MPKEMGYDYLGMSFQEKKAQQGVSPTWFLECRSFSFSDSCGALRKLVTAIQRPVRHACRGVWRVPHALVARNAKQHLRANRFDHADRFGCENAILIVEFAKDEYEKGKPLLDAALEGARLRLRPILMTSFAFIFGCLPLWTATGSGAVARRVLGSTVIGGMIAASALAIFLIPVTFYVIERLFAGRREKPEAKVTTSAPVPEPAIKD